MWHGLQTVLARLALCSISRRFLGTLPPRPFRIGKPSAPRRTEANLQRHLMEGQLIPRPTREPPGVHVSSRAPAVTGSALPPRPMAPSWWPQWEAFLASKPLARFTPRPIRDSFGQKPARRYGIGIASLARP